MLCCTFNSVMLLFKLRALTLCMSIFWYFSFFPIANLSNAVCSEELKGELKELAKGSGVCLIFGSLNVKERWVRSAEAWGRPGSAPLPLCPSSVGSCSTWEPECCPGTVANKPHGEWDQDLEWDADLMWPSGSRSKSA